MIATTKRAVAACACVLAVAAIGATSAQASAGAQTFSWGKAVPISTKAPRWFTLKLYKRVIAAGAKGVPLSSIRMSRKAASKGGSKGGKGGGGGGSSSTSGSSACMYQNGTSGTGSFPSTPNGVERPPVGIGPGTWLISLFCDNVGGHAVPDGFAWCTANFVFTNGSSYGLGTAGHCGAKDALGSPVTAVVQPPPEVCANGGSCAPGLYAIGTFKIVHNNGVGDDFALIQLYPQFNSWVRPTMPVFGGPTGSYLGGLPTVPGQTLSMGPATVLTPAYSPALLGQCGHGAVVGTGGTCRSHAGLFSFGTAYAWYGPSFEGDSGSGVEILGNPTGGGVVPAAADLTHIIELYAHVGGNSVTEGPWQPGMVAGTQMSKILQIVGSGWQLVPGGLP